MRVCRILGKFSARSAPNRIILSNDVPILSGAQQPQGCQRLYEAGSRVSPPSSTTSNSSNVPISDPFIDVNWPGRPKRNSMGEDFLASASNTASTMASVALGAASKVPTKRQVSTPSPGTASKPPIFPSSPKVLGN